MRIKRHGSSVHRGISSITLNKPRFRWDEKTLQIIIKDIYVEDFSTPSTHDYEIEMGLDEVITWII